MERYSFYRSLGIRREKYVFLLSNRLSPSALRVVTGYTVCEIGQEVLLGLVV